MATIIASPVEPYRSLCSEVYELLREAIIVGRLAPGERVVEAEVARQMTIRRAPVREAIRKLERDGLVEYHPRRGASVVSLSPKQVYDAYQMRGLRKGHGARLAVAQLTPALIAELERLLDGMRSAAQQDNLKLLIALDVEFHAVICRASGSRLLEEFRSTLHPPAGRS